MMTVARYWESTINKTEILFSVFAIKFLASAIFFLDNGSTYKMNNGPNEKKKKMPLCVKNQTVKIEWNQNMNM